MKGMKTVSALLPLALLFFSCAQPAQDGQTAPSQAAYEKAPVLYDQESEVRMNEELSGLYDAYYDETEGRTLGSGEAEAYMAEFNRKYGTDVILFDEGRGGLINKWGGGGGYGDPDMAVPYDTDGAIYICGGAKNPIGWGIEFLTPKYSKGGYYHAAILDLDRYDPSNEETRCLQTALMKGADYQSALEWRTMCNMAVLNPISVSEEALDEAQEWMHTYAKAENTDQMYGFFENVVNLKKPIDKRDEETFYCTKVCWQVYDRMGVDIDTNTQEIDHTKAKVWPMIKGFYRARYFWSKSKADQKAAEFMRDTLDAFVIADEMYTSPDLKKVYENIHEPALEDGFVR